MKTHMLLCFLCLFSFATLSAQQRAVTGIVKDNTGEAVIGATVSVKGTSVITVTDIDGKFSLNAPQGSKTVVFKYIGMNTKEVTIANSPMTVMMEGDDALLDEVVVIGYGTVKRRDLTGSVSSVGSKQLEAIPVANISEALVGKLPGVSIMTTEGSPDADVKIRVRGGGSLSQDNSPLYIVDGFEVKSISDIAPTEIQNVDVLKDASSTAIYGAKGANGVIIITTKSGHEGKTQVSFGASFGLKKATKLVKTLSPYDYALYQHEIATAGSSEYGAYSDLDIWRSVKGNDFQDEIFGREGNQKQYNANVSGGTKETKYSVSYARNDEKSIMLGSGFKKDNLNVKIGTNIRPNLKLDFNARLSYQTVDGLSGGADNETNAANSLVANAVRFRPINPLIANNDDDEDLSTSKQYNPLERLNATSKEKTTFTQTYSGGLSWNFLEKFTARTDFGYGWRYIDTDNVWESPATQSSKLGYAGLPQAVQTRQQQLNWRNSNTLTYETKKLFLKSDKLSVLVGHEISSNESKKSESTSVAFPAAMTINEILADMSHGTALPNITYIDPNENMLSYFGRINYTIDDKYLFTATMRADASSKFAEANRWGYFPSAAFAWRMSEEDFMKSTQSWLSNLKLRLSIGTAGNNRIKSGLLTTQYASSGNSAKAPFFDETYTNMMEHGTTLPNPTLKWETTLTRNLGVDYGFLKNRISGSLDLYWNTTKDLLMLANIPANTGYVGQYQNFGQTSNKGVELSLTAVIVDKKDFGLDFNFNISYNESKIDKLNTDTRWQSSNWAGSTLSKYEDFEVKEGGRLGEIWGYKTNGFYTVYDANTNPNGELIWQAGKWALKGDQKDKSPTVTGGNYYPGGLKLECDTIGDPLKQRLGNTVAPVYGGFGFNARYKNFDFSAFFNYSLGNKIVNGTKLATSFYTGSAKGYTLNNDFRSSNRYTWIDSNTGLNLGKGLSTTIINQYGGIDNVINRLNEMNANASIFNPAAVTGMQLIDYAVEDASFLRVNNLSIGYTIPKSIIQKLQLQTVRLYATGYNLFCITKYTGSDPEVDTSGKKNAMTPGVDYAAYPKSRSFVVGLNLTF